MTHAPLLIADDSMQKILLLEHFLKKAQWTTPVLIAHSGSEALRMIDEHPDIAFGLIDFYMPDHNGPAVIAHLKQKNPAARIALVSSADNEENFTKARAAGAETCICTSYESHVVEQTIMELIESWKVDLVS
jgi:CheY-like chemotaxis protein